MTDAFPMEAAPAEVQMAPEPIPGGGAEMGAPMDGMAPPAPAATPGALLAAQGEQARMRPPLVDSDMSARDRLVYAPQVRNPVPPPGEAIAVEEPHEQAKRLSGLPDMTSGLVNVAARLAQARDAGDPDKTAAAWDRVTKVDTLRGPIKEHIKRLMSGDPLSDEDWEQLRIGVEQVSDALEHVSEDGTIGGGRVVAVDQEEDGAFVQLDYDDLGLDNLPDSLGGYSGTVLPAHTLNKQAGSFTVFAGPDDVVYAADPTPANDVALRNFFPGPVGVDGKPRWLPIEPLPLRDHQVLQSASLVAPTAEVESWADRAAYPGVLPGDWISVDVPDGPFREPSWAKGRSVTVKGGINRSGPAYSLAPVPKADLTDAVVVDEKRRESSWAVLSPQGDPKATAKMLSAVGDREPIELKGDSKAWLVFGVTPDEAARLSPKRPVYVNDGLINGETPDVDPSWTFKTGDGRSYTLMVESAATTVGTPRAESRSQRRLFRVQPDEAERIGQLAQDLELAGAKNATIYSRSQELDGWVRAREHSYSDGVSVKVERTTDTGPSLNSTPVYVRSDAGLPTAPSNVSESVVDPVPVDPESGRIVLEAEGDLAPVVRQAAILAHKYGPDAVRIVGEDGEIRLAQ